MTAWFNSPEGKGTTVRKMTRKGPAFRLIMVSMAAVFVGCSSEETCEGDACGTGGGGGNTDCTDIPAGADTCTPQETALRRCKANTVLEECDGCAWLTAKDCAVANAEWVCRESQPGVAACGDPYDKAGQYSLCGLGFGGLWYGVCDNSLTCGLAFNGTRCGCVRPCADNPSACDAATEYCNTKEFPAGACFPLGGYFDSCKDDSECAAGLTCRPRGTDFNRMGCVLDCSADETLCAEGEFCDDDTEFNMAVCNHRPNKYDACQANGAPCPTGLLCRTDRDGRNACYRLCTTDPGLCGKEEYCDEDVWDFGSVCLRRDGEFEGCVAGSCAPGYTCADGPDGDVCVRNCEEFPERCVAGVEYCDTSGAYAGSACLRLNQEFERCGAGLAGCVEGLTCSAGPNGAVCVRACAQDSSRCYGYEYCDTSGVYAESACLLLADEFKPCGDGVGKCRAPYECSAAPGGAICVQPCADDPEICAELESCDTSGIYSLSACIRSARELESCGPGDGICFLGLQCARMGSRSICTRPCDGLPDACDPDTEYCAASIGENGTCLPTDQPGEAPCITDEGCAEELTCEATFGPTSTCKLACDGSEVGTQGSCPAGTTCLSTGILELQTGGGIGGITCNPDNPAAACDTGSNYGCHPKENPLTGQITNVCARFKGQCGTELPLLTSLTYGDLAALPDENNCGRASLSAYCPDYSGTEVTAEVSCESTGFGSILQANGRSVTCTSDADCKFIAGALTADALCVNFSSGDVVCAQLSQACVAFCEPGEDGVEKTCPAGTACMAPTAPHEGMGAGSEQGGGAQCFNDSDCTDSACVEAPTSDGGSATFCLAPCESDADCLTDNICYDAGFMGFCIHYPKVCLAPLTQEDNCSVVPL